MSQTSQQVIERLRTIAPQDREWLLRSLSVEERHLVLNALMGENAGIVIDDAVDHVNGNGQDHSAALVSSNKHDPRLTALMHASADEVAAILRDESEWAIVVLLQFTAWPWANDFLGTLTSAKVHSLREAAVQIGQSVKPKVGEALALIVASRLQRRAPQNIHRSMFDMALERAHNGAPRIAIDKEAGE